MRVREVVVVEGRCDVNAVKRAVDAAVVETSGFGIFSDREKLKLLRALGAERGLLVLTDADGAGFVIRNFLRGSLAGIPVKHAYIPDVYGKERRKRRPSGEGKLGVEGMPDRVILEALARAGATFEDAPGEDGRPARRLGKRDLYLSGLSGRPESARRRRELLKRLSLPEHLNANAMLEALNILAVRPGYREILEEYFSWEEE